MEGVTETTYTNTIEELPYVTSIEMSPSNPKEGDTVSITFYPDEQHGVDTSNVRIRYYLEDGTEAWVVPTANGTSSNYLEFIQPAGNCYIDGIIVSTILPGADEGTLTIGSMSVGSDSDPFDSDLYQLWGYTNHEYLKSVVRDHEITEDIGSCTLETKGIKCIYDISFWGGHAFDITIDKNNQYGIDDNCYLFLIADNPDNLSEFTLTWTDAEHYPDDMDQNTVEFGGPSVFDNYYLYRNTYSRVFSDNEVGKTYTIKVDKDAFSRRIKK